MKATKCPTDELSLKNRAIVHPSDVMHEDKFIDISTGKILTFCSQGFSNYSISSGPGLHFIFAIERSPEVQPRSVGFSLLQRKWGMNIIVNHDGNVIYYRLFFF
jgi:hypothetical protein